LGKEITDSGAKLFDLLGREKELSEDRAKAMGFLDNITRNFESNTEQDYIEKFFHFPINFILAHN
jgi:clusterin-associated protein 1